MSTLTPVAPGAERTGPAPAFQQGLGLFDATMLVAGSMIGSGIFIVSAQISRDVGTSGWLLAVWALTGVMTVIGALSYAELAAMMPQAGGQYIYLREAYSPLWAFLYGWTAFLVIQTGFIAAVSVAFAKFLGVLVPELGTDHIVAIYALPVLGKTLQISAGQFVAVGVIVFLAGLNCLGVREGKWVQNLFTVTKTLALCALIVVGLTIAANPEAIIRNTADLWRGITHTEKLRDTLGLLPVTLRVTAGGNVLAVLMLLGGAMVGSLFSADAWNNVTFTAGETRNPRRNLPLSLAMGTGLVITLYLLANIAYLAALPLEGTEHASTPFARGIQFARDDRVGTAVIELVSPTWGARLMAIGIMVSTFGCVNGLTLMGARLYYAMAKDGLFFERVGRLSGRGVPAAGLVLQGLWAILLTFSGTYNQLLDYIIFATLMFYVLTVSGLFVLRRTRPNAERPYRAFGYPVLPGLYVVLAALIMLDLLVVKPLYTWPGMIIVLTGIPVYFLWRLRARLAGPRQA
jgi:APA family basic amino acid/polyamine antiporter